MPGKKRFVYWDSCVILSYIQGDADRLPVLDQLLSLSADPGSDLRIITSTLSIAEVAYVTEERVRGVLDPVSEAAIEAIWDGSAIDLVEFHAGIARQARSLTRQVMTRGWSLRSADACQLASALYIDAVDFHTYDDRLFRFSQVCGFPVRLPSIEQPAL